MKFTNSYILPLVGLIMTFTLAWQGRAVPDAIYWLVGGYVGFRAGAKASYVMSASKDVEANTEKVIKDVEGRK
jgi:hypothetical protein